jgi:hypothetical protein
VTRAGTGPRHGQPASSVTVVIATRNRVDELCRTVRRLTGLSERSAIVMVDNASDDGTPVVIRRDRRPEVLRTLDRTTALPGRPPVIVVNNASSDGSATAAGRYDGVRVIRAPALLSILAGASILRVTAFRQAGASHHGCGWARTSTAHRYVG